MKKQVRWIPSNGKSLCWMCENALGEDDYWECKVTGEFVCETCFNKEVYDSEEEVCLDCGHIHD